MSTVLQAPRPAAVLDAMWAQIEPAVFITRAEWERGLDGWTIEEVRADGALAGAVLTCGPEIHFAAFGRHVPISLRMIRERVQPLIERHGYACTRTPKDATRQRRINETLGFVLDGEDEFFVRYRINAWRRACPSSP